MCDEHEPKRNTILTMQGERQALSEEAFGLSAGCFWQCWVLRHDSK